MFCHNDYSIGNEPYIIIYDGRFELYSYGGLPQGLSKEDFEIMDNFITITFRYSNDALKMLYSKPFKIDSNLTEQEQIIIKYIKEYGSIRRKTVEDILNIKNLGLKRYY